MNKKKIFVTKPFLPNKKEYNRYILKIYENCILTNQGPLLNELEGKLREYLNVNYLHFLSNGTIALQLALNALEITGGEIITTPFSYVATVSSILWERCDPVFVDIEKNNFTINVDEIEKNITSRTKAILAVHVFGYACDVEKIEKIAKKYNLKVIYDAAHAFGSLYNGKSLLDYGDISTCSFHATKLFHTVEGGACITKNEEINKKLNYLKQFGIQNNVCYNLGINAKNSEFHAAMGLSIFPHIDGIISERKSLIELYDSYLYNVIERPKTQKSLKYNNAYYPILFKNEAQLLLAIEELNKENVFPRRYFFPSLNILPYLKNKQSCPVSEDVSSRILCLPIYSGLNKAIIKKISNIVWRVCKNGAKN